LNYCPLTKADALAAKKRNAVKKERSTPAAALLPAEPVIPVAVVMPSAVLGDGTDSEYFDTPCFIPHFFFGCSISSPSASAELNVRALINDGSNAVLIDPTYANHLSFAHWKQLKPKEVNPTRHGHPTSVRLFWP
jgi:hypothetical protein